MWNCDISYLLYACFISYIVFAIVAECLSHSGKSVLQHDKSFIEKAGEFFWLQQKKRHLCWKIQILSSRFFSSETRLKHCVIHACGIEFSCVPLGWKYLIERENESLNTVNPSLCTFIREVYLRFTFKRLFYRTSWPAFLKNITRLLKIRETLSRWLMIEFNINHRT